MYIKRNGCTRLVIVLDKIVIKVPNFTCQWSHLLKGLIGNMNENNCWKANNGRYEQDNSHLLCPVIWASWGGWVLVMKKVDRVYTYDDPVIDYSIWHDAGFGGDDKPDNYGVLNNRVIKIDYGS